MPTTLRLWVSLVVLTAGSVSIAYAECPPFPAFPDEDCTGWQHTGVTLTTYTGPTTITTAGTVVDSKQINSSITIAADNVTIKRSQVNGQIFISGSTRTGVLVEDVRIIAGNVGGQVAGQCIGGNSSTNGGATAAGFVIRRVNMSGCAQGVYGRGFTLEDSYIHDLWGEGVDHNEPILGHRGDIIIRHNYLHAAFSADSTGGGMSAVIALYSHSAFWPDINNVLVEKNYLRTANSGAGRAGYCFYGGNSPDNSGNATNTAYVDNVFARGSLNICGQYGPIVYMPSGGNNCASNNRYEDGALIAFGLEACETAEDTTPPTVTSRTIGTTGQTLTLAMSETVTATGTVPTLTSCSGGATTLTYSSGSGTSSLAYTISRQVLGAETGCVNSYTQPGDGIEDSAGNDVASFSNRAVTNSSTATLVALSGLTPSAGTRLRRTLEQTTIGVTTDKAATCRWGPIPGLAWADLTAYTTTGSTSHSSTLAVTPGTVYQICARCLDTAAQQYSADACAAWDVRPERRLH